MRRLLGVLLIALAGLAAGQEYEHYGQWVVTSLQDEFTDEVRKAAMLPPTKQPSILYNTILTVLCDPEGSHGVLTAVFDHPEFLFGRTTPVTYRVDGKEAREGAWIVGSSFVGPVAGVAAEFLNEMVGGEGMILRLRDGGEVMTFRVAGFSDAMRALECYTGPL